jgi:hypothetical protein
MQSCVRRWPRHVRERFVVLATVGATSRVPCGLISRLSMPSIIVVMVRSKLG